MPLSESRRVFWSIGVVLALHGMALVVMVPVVPGPAEAASPASDNERPMHVAPAKPVKIVQVSADLSRDLDRLETRAAGGEVFDLFSPSAESSSRPKGKAGGTRMVPAEPPKGEEDEVGVITHDTVVVAPPMEPVVVPPDPAPVVSAPLPPVIPPVVAAPAPPPPPPPPAPKPPAVPFAYIGKFEEGDRTVYFLVKGDKLYMVKPGEDIDDAYSFDGETDNQLQLTYKPLRVAQTLTVGPR